MERAEGGGNAKQGKKTWALESRNDDGPAQRRRHCHHDAIRGVRTD